MRHIYHAAPRVPARHAFGASLLFLLCTGAAAESAWVTDQFEITLRSGPSTSNAIERMLKSGAELEVLERDRETGYSRVRTPGGTEGYVLSRYLMPEPSAREQLSALAGQLTDATAEGQSLGGQLQAVRRQYDEATATIAALEADKARLTAELEEIRRTAASTLEIREQNASLRNVLATRDTRIESLEQSNRELSSQNMRYWFLSGAGVLLFGLLLGLWLPRLRQNNRSRYRL